MENEVLVEKTDLIPAVQKLLAEKARFGTATCLDLGDKFEIIYHFEPQKSPEPLKHVKVRIPKEDTLPSISAIYLCAALVENEIQDHFAIRMEGIAPDFERKFVRSKESPGTGLLKPVPYEVKPLARLRVGCSDACPANIDVPRYVQLIGEGKFVEALAVIKQALPFPGILGRVCLAPCESACRRAKQEEPIAIRMLKRFVYDHATYREERPSKRTGKRVAIIGSGPAGLTAAYYLAKMGHEVTIYESLPQAGGMMRAGIPPYRLPREILDDEIDMVKNLGVEIKTNTRVESLDKLFKDGYQALLVATGAHQGIKLGVEGEDHPRVMECIDFLRDVNFGRKVHLGDRVAVIGGGNAAIDAARTAIRLGAKEVSIFYRHTLAAMPASPSQVEEAMKEGVKIEFLVAPKRVLSKPVREVPAGGSETILLEILRMKLGSPDASGRLHPEPIEGSEFRVDVDSVIAAIGRHPEIPAQFKIETGRENVIVVNPNTRATSREGVFAVGDAVVRAASVVRIVRAAKRVALSIDRYLGGDGILPVEEINVEEPRARDTFIERWARENKRIEMPTLAIEDRLRGFDEVELGLDEEMAMAESLRCWRCNLEE